ncbi:MAG: FkbM family methyltransferase [Verrucomicrobia bacterium]|nr:FkbM family methyltransferase [Verrucomicrobiota bacterium]
MLSLIDHYFIKKPYVRRFVTRLIAGDRTVRIKLLGAEMEVNTILEHGLFRAARLTRTVSVFRDELPILMHLMGLLQPFDTFLDIGANVGIYAVNVARMKSVYPNLKVYAFEPNPDTAARLRANTAPWQVECYECALSDHDGNLNFVGGADSKVYTTIENASAYSILSEQSNRPCKRLDGIPIEGDSIIMKIDVEGQEWEVLSGASSYFEADRVKAVYLDGYKDWRARRFLEEYKFVFFNGRTLKTAEPETQHLLAFRREKFGCDLLVASRNPNAL